MITIAIDGREVQTEDRTYLIEVCEPLGISIPTLCHRKGIEPYGACRICIVEMEQKGRTRFVTGCNYPVRNGMKFQTASPRVLAVRRLILESLLARCPGAEALKELARSLGVEKTRFPVAEDRSAKCILCGLCVRVCREIVGAFALEFTGRGVERQVGTAFLVHPESCIGCGACADVCPTGAINMEKTAAEAFRDEAGRDRLCRYALLGLVPAALCANSFDCYRCAVDQRFRELHDEHPAFVAAGALGPGPAAKQDGP